MGSTATYYCWHCYCPNSSPAGSCVECGRDIEQPPGTTWTDQLLWALGHPIPENQMMAAQILGERREIAAADPLRALVESCDPYLAAQALRSLVSIVGAAAIADDLLQPLADSGAPAVRRVALRALSARG